MPLFSRELNELADRIRRSTLTVYLHTATPSNANPTNGRVTSGGGSYSSGFAVTASNISMASNGDIMITVAMAFGTSTAALGTVTHWSAYRGSDPVAFDTLPNTTIGIGDTFTIDANSLALNGATS